MENAKAEGSVGGKGLELCIYAGCLRGSCATSLCQFIRIRFLPWCLSPMPGQPFAITLHLTLCTLCSHVAFARHSPIFFRGTTRMKGYYILGKPTETSLQSSWSASITPFIAILVFSQSMKFVVNNQPFVLTNFGTSPCSQAA